MLFYNIKWYAKNAKNAKQLKDHKIKSFGEKQNSQM